MRALRRFVALTLVAVGLTVASTGFAVELDPAQEIEANLIFEAVLSPFCPGRLLRDCPSTAAQELKDKIRGMVVEGKPRGEIENYLFALYGDTIRSVPPKHGFGNVAWWGPGVFLVIGLGILGVWLRSKRTAPEPTGPELTAEMKARIERHLTGNGE